MEIAMMRAQPPRKVVNALPLLKASLYLMTLPSGGSSLEESIQTSNSRHVILLWGHLNITVFMSVSKHEGTDEVHRTIHHFHRYV